MTVVTLLVIHIKLLFRKESFLLLLYWYFFHVSIRKSALQMSYYFHNLFQVILLVKRTFVMLLLTPLSTIFQLYRAVSFIGEGNRIDTDCKVVVNPATIRSRPRRVLICFMLSGRYIDLCYCYIIIGAV